MSKKAPIKASSYSRIGDLLNKDERSLDSLDFTDFAQKHGEDALDKLYPKNEKYGKLYPPPQYLINGAAVRRWRKISDSEQKHIIKNTPLQPSLVTGIYPTVVDDSVKIVG